MFGLGFQRIARRRVAAFDPSQLGPLLWLRADAVVIGAGGVAAMVDKTGNGRSPTQGTPALRPALTASNAAARGRPSVDFDGVDDVLRWTGTMAQPLHLFLVCTPVTDGDFVGGGAQPIDGGSGNSARLYIPSAVQVAFFAGGSQITDTAADTEAPMLTEVVMDGASSSLRVDARTAVTGTLTGDPGGVTLGTFGDGSGNVTACSWFELLAYSGALSSGESDLVRAYIADRYGVTA